MTCGELLVVVRRHLMVVKVCLVAAFLVVMSDFFVVE